MTLIFLAEPICQLLYHQTAMTAMLKSLALPFILYAIQPCLTSVLHAFGCSKEAMMDTLAGSVIRLGCMTFLTVPLRTAAVPLALVAGMLTTTLLHLGRVLHRLFQHKQPVLLPQTQKNL